MSVIVVYSHSLATVEVAGHQGISPWLSLFNRNNPHVRSFPGCQTDFSKPGKRS